MKKTLFGMMAFVAMAIVGCSNEPVEQDVFVGGADAAAFYGSIESQDVESDTRTTLGTDNVITWNVGDAITIFKTSGYVQKYEATQGGSADVKFTYANWSEEHNQTLTSNYSVYPHGIATNFDGDTETFTVDMSSLATQAYAENSFESGKAIMVSKSSNDNLVFKNTMSIIRFKLSSSVPGDYVVTNIKVSSTKAMAGEGTISMSDNTAVVAEGGATSIEVAIPEGIVLKTEPTLVYMVIPAGSYPDFKINIDGYENTIEKEPINYVAEYPAGVNYVTKRNLINTVTKNFTSEDWSGSTGGGEAEWDGQTVAEPEVEDGVININTPAEMAWLGTELEGGVLPVEIHTININGSFDMKGLEFTPITLSEEVKASVGQSLTINGNNNTISNVNFVGEQAAGFVWSKVGYCNVVINDLKFKACSAKSAGYAAIVVPFCHAAVTLSNVHVEDATIKGLYGVAGLIGDCQSVGQTKYKSTIKDCSVSNSTIENTYMAGESGLVASVVGRANCGLTVSNTSATGNKITAFVGDTQAQKRTIGYYVGNFTASSTYEYDLVITGATQTNNAITTNTEGMTQKNIYGEFLGGWRNENSDKCTVSINGVEIAPFIDTQDEFAAAIAKGGVIYLSANATGEAYTWVAPKKDVTIIGREGLATRGAGLIYPATINFGSGNLNAGASNIAFEKLNLNFVTQNYTGFHHSASSSFKFCNITGTVWTYAPQVVFENCYFEEMTNNYNIWVYSSCTASIKDCSFKSDNKSILIYGEGARNYNVTVEGCSFEAARATDKCAIQIHTDSRQITGTLVLNNNTVVAGYENTNGGLWKEWVNGKYITNDVVKIIDGENLDEAVVAAIEAGGNVTLTQPLNVPANGITIPAGVTTNLDLGGYTISIKAGESVVDFNNYGTLNISNGKIVSENAVNARRCIYNRAGGVMTIDGVEFVQNYESKGAAINNAGTMTIEDATVTSNYYCIWNELEGELTINGGTYTCNSYASDSESTAGPTYSSAIKNLNDATLTINGGVFNLTHTGVETNNNAKTTINAGEFNDVATKTQSRHAFWVEENGVLTIPADSKAKVKWSTINGSTVVYNYNGDAANISIVGGLYDITKTHGKTLYFLGSGDETYPYKAVTALEHMQNAINNSENYTLQENVNGTLTFRNNVVLDGAENTISAQAASSQVIAVQSGGTLKNFVVNNAAGSSNIENKGIAITNLSSDLLIDGCTISSGAGIGLYCKSTVYGVKVTNSTIIGGCTRFSENNSGAKYVIFENVTFKKDANAAQNTIRNLTTTVVELNNCALEGGYTINNYGKVILRNCTYNDKLITADNKNSFRFREADKIVVENAKLVTSENVDDAVAALANGEDVLLVEDVETAATTSSGYGKAGFVVVDGGVLDGGNNTLTVNSANETWDCAINPKSGTIKNITVNGAFRGFFMSGATGDVYLDNVYVDKVCYTFNSDAGNKDYGVYFSNSTFKGWTSFTNAHKEVIFTNCKFGMGTGGYKYAFCRPYNDAVFENCEFNDEFEFDTTQASNIVLKNCTYNGTPITAENVLSLKTVVNGEDVVFFYNGMGNAVIE